MKNSILLFSIVFFVFIASAQTTKTPVKATPSVKVDFLKARFQLDPAIFSSSSIDSSNRDRKELNIKLTNIKSAIFTVAEGSATTVDEWTEMLKKVYKANAIIPTSSGFTFEKVYGGAASLNYMDESVTTLEYKAVFHGTKNQQELEKAMALMPKARDLNEPKNSKPINKFDTDENNRIIRTYLLESSPGTGTVFMRVYYEANYADDKKNEGLKVLQAFMNGISQLKINEYTSFSKVNNAKFMIDMALPSAEGGNGHYSFKQPDGNITISNIPNASEGYAAQLESYSAGTANRTVINKGDIEKHLLYNGIQVFTRLFTLQDNDYKFISYEYVSVIVPNNKAVKKPLLISIQTYIADLSETTALNAFILNSISMPGTLTKTAIDKLKDNYKN
ncbi:MAG: hypothetical protein E6H07_07865 [Bacteroidetes bacterium]|nr:MAG: hypothetical protein E6H07_07865 [Bacteroidota bacterium]